MILAIIKQNILKHKFIFIINFLTLFLLTTSIVLSNFLFTNIKQNLLIESFWKQANKFIIQNKENNLLKGFLFKQETLADIYKQLQHDKNINKVFGIYSVNLPISAQILFWPLNFKTDIFLFSSDEWNLCFSWKYLALWINPTLINLYNLQIANPPLFPKINPQLLSKLDILLTFGKNSFYSNQKNITQKAKIVLVNENLPVLWLSIGYKVVQEIIHKLWFWSQKLIKIIWYTKNTNYLKQLKTKYPEFKITTIFDTKKQLYKKVEKIKNIFNIINLFIIILSIWFLVNFSVNLTNRYDQTIKVLTYNKVSKIKWLFIPSGEIVAYFILVSTTSYTLTFWINKNLQVANQYLLNQGYYVSLVGLTLLDTTKILLTVFSIVFFISTLTFILKYRKTI